MYLPSPGSSRLGAPGVLPNPHAPAPQCHLVLGAQALRTCWVCKGGCTWLGEGVKRALQSSGDKCQFQGAEGLSLAPSPTSTWATEFTVRAPARKTEFQDILRVLLQAAGSRPWRRQPQVPFKGWGQGRNPRSGLETRARSVLS